MYRVGNSGSSDDRISYLLFKRPLPFHISVARIFRRACTITGRYLICFGHLTKLPLVKVSVDFTDFFHVTDKIEMNVIMFKCTSFVSADLICLLDISTLHQIIINYTVIQPATLAWG